jgi:hypothetical protein
LQFTVNSLQYTVYSIKSLCLSPSTSLRAGSFTKGDFPIIMGTRGEREGDFVAGVYLTLSVPLSVHREGEGISGFPIHD